MKGTGEVRSKRLLIIFYRNPQLGRIKTRLAAEIGDSKALAIYLFLSAHTRNITEHLAEDKVVFYSDYIDTEDSWSNSIYQKQLQNGADLGQKMYNAFLHGFEKGYGSICIIGTDCFELTSSIIADAFNALTSSDAVIGPAKDGGYYLLGMNRLRMEYFENKSWSTDSVLKDTIADFEKAEIKFHELPVLSDVDVRADLPDELRHLA